jgi:hypothetical protein
VSITVQLIELLFADKGEKVREKLILTTKEEDIRSVFMANNTLLDNINPNFFEGVEKLLEIWFAPNANADLRKIPR